MRVLGALAIVLLAARAEAACPTRASSFPRRTTEIARNFPARVRSLDDALFTLEGEDEERKGVRTDAVLVVHQGALVYERYARGYGKDSPHLAWSVTKTVTSLLAGIAVAQGALALDDSICRTLGSVAEGRCAITVRHLLQFASGLDWKEDYEGGARQDSSVIAMLVGQGRRDMAAFVLEQPLAEPPGTAFRYSTGDSTLLARVVDVAMRPRFGDDYPWTVLFEPLGIESMTMERDASGFTVGGAYSYATAEDWARLGLFMLDDGCWRGTRVLPEGYLREATTPSAPFLTKRLDDDPSFPPEQGFSIWLNRTVPGVRDRRPWPSAPEDTFAAVGHWNQLVVVIPSRDLVVVRSGDDRDESALDIDRFLRLAIALTGEP